MCLGVAVNLAGRCLQYSRIEPLSQGQQVVDPTCAGDQGANRIGLIADRRGGTSEIVNFIRLDPERLEDVMIDELEARAVRQMTDVARIAGDVVVYAQHVVTVREQSFAEIGTEKSGAPANQNSLTHSRFHGPMPPVLRLQRPAPCARSTGPRYS
jgi:hypothetical protein